MPAQSPRHDDWTRDAPPKKPPPSPRRAAWQQAAQRERAAVASRNSRRAVRSMDDGSTLASSLPETELSSDLDWTRDLGVMEAEARGGFNLAEARERGRRLRDGDEQTWAGYAAEGYEWLEDVSDDYSSQAYSDAGNYGGTRPAPRAHSPVVGTPSRGTPTRGSRGQSPRSWLVGDHVIMR